MYEKYSDPKFMMASVGVDFLGGAQRSIAYTVIADYGKQKLKITAAAHGLKEGQGFNITTGTAQYQGSYRVLEVIDANNIVVSVKSGTVFGATTSGNIALMGARGGAGFMVMDATALVISEFIPESDFIDGASLRAAVAVMRNGDVFMVPFKSMIITGGSVMVFRKGAQTRSGIESQI